MSIKKWKRRAIKFFFREQWSILIADTSGKILTEIIPPADRIWADPFPVIYDDHFYIFLEEQEHGSLGRLGFLEVDAEMKVSPFTPVLEKAYHLSWPNVFPLGAAGNQVWYMIPESHENGTIDLYRATDFPRKWEIEATLMRDVVAVDTELIHYQGAWWLFFSRKDGKYGLNDSLWLYRSETFPSTDWKPAAKNPVVTGSGASRMAGKIYHDETLGALVRPAQSCRKDYGEHVALNRIDVLDEGTYAESLHAIVRPEKSIGAVCTHTWNRCGDFIVRDVKKRHFKGFLPWSRG